jgi:hypothetical protein
MHGFLIKHEYVSGIGSERFFFYISLYSALHVGKLTNNFFVEAVGSIVNGNRVYQAGFLS